MIHVPCAFVLLPLGTVDVDQKEGAQGCFSRTQPPSGAQQPSLLAYS